MGRTKKALSYLGAVLLMVSCASSPASEFLTKTLHLDRFWSLVLSGITTTVVGVLIGVQPLAALLLGMTGAAVSNATAPDPAPSNIVNNNGKGKVIVNGTSGSSGFLGVPTFWWGVIAVCVVLFALRNRVHLTALATGQVPRGQRLSTVLGMFVGTPRPPQPPSTPPPTPSAQ